VFRPTTGTVMDNVSLGRAYHLTIKAPSIAAGAQPGQFVHIRCGDTYDPLLRRPFSLHRFDPEQGTIEILYRIIGKGTEILSRKKAGENLDLMGPLGKAFSLPGSRPAVLVGGGMGVAPLLALADKLVDSGVKVTALIGANHVRELFRVEEFVKRGASVELATLDGSAGFPGPVTELLERHLHLEPESFIYACGPDPMLKLVGELAASYGTGGEVSLESFMACGVGACLGCVYEIFGEKGRQYARVCTEGPVFPLEVVVKGELS
jgi:dihydroorotate dehydrogenase electron transfer subunit